MGKILKYCSSCEEGFAQKFSFCPNCASELSAFEMKPVTDEPVAEPVQEETPAEEPVVAAPTPIVEEAPKEAVEPTPEVVEEPLFEPVAFEAENTEEPVEAEEEAAMVAEFDEEIIEYDTVDASEEDPETSDESESDSKAKVAGATSAAVASPVTTLFGTDGIPEQQGSSSGDGFAYAPVNPEDDEFGVTVINEKAGTLKRSLLLGASVLVVGVVFGSVMWSIFNHPLFVAAIGDDDILLPLLVEAPMDLEEEKPKSADDDDSGGGGGGGRENPKEASRGELPTQTRDPIPQPPQVIPRMKDPELAQIQRTEGDIKRERTERVGIPGSLSDIASSGRGSGGGIGSGRGTGVGSGRGTGEGSGIGSGSGSGVGDGTGDGRGNGRGRGRTPPIQSGPTAGIKILSKPRPGYTDRARQNNVQGTVMLRVTFLASGRVGSVSAIKGLPHGLTQKAIAAARRIRFKPAMRNGSPYSVTKRIQYNFTIY